jgi:hypothetical protein
LLREDTYLQVLQEKLKTIQDIYVDYPDKNSSIKELEERIAEEEKRTTEES